MHSSNVHSSHIIHNMPIIPKPKLGKPKCNLVQTLGVQLSTVNGVNVNVGGIVVR